MDDVGAATKQNEVYGRTRIPLGPIHIPFPGNFLFIKYIPGIKKWGPYPEMTPRQLESYLSLLETNRWPVTLGVTASWVEDDGRLTPYPVKYPEQARLLKKAAEHRIVEIANHGLTHCVLEGKQFRPRLFSSNRTAHREFWDWVPEGVHRENLERSQDILQSYFDRPIETLIPPGNVYQPMTIRIAKTFGIKTVSCRTPSRVEDGVAYVGDDQLLAFHDREMVLFGESWLSSRLQSVKATALQFVGDLGKKMLQEQPVHV